MRCWCATHDVEFVASVADDVVVLADGEVVSAGPTLRVVVESPSFAPQVHKVLGAPWLRVDQVADALAGRSGSVSRLGRTVTGRPGSGADLRRRARRRSGSVYAVRWCWCWSRSSGR